MDIQKAMRRQNQRGYTLVEFIIAVSVITILSTLGIAGLLDYSRSQTLQAAAADVSAMLHVAKSRAASQVVPTQCATQVLEGYRVAMCGVAGSSCVSGSDERAYELAVVCSGMYLIEHKRLPAHVSFGSGTTPFLLFRVLTGGVEGQGTIRIDGFGKPTKVITVDDGGSISVN